MTSNEERYLSLMLQVLQDGERRTDRTGVGTRSLFGCQVRYDLRQGFPLLTTKNMAWNQIVAELLWFIQGSPNLDFLHAHNTHIWDANAAANSGQVGPIYGKQWRNWEGWGGQQHDQLAELVQQLKDNPYSRRHLVSAWNVEDLEKMCLPPCHVLFQCYVSQDGWLDLQFYQRSADLFLGVPFNIASYSLLLSMLAQCTGYRPRFLVHTLGDAHLYTNHLDQAREQLSRQPTDSPRLYLNSDVTDIDGFMPFHILLKGYYPQPAIRAEMAV